LQPALQAAVAVVAFRRRLHKDFPVFFAYILVQIALFAVEFPVYHYSSSSTYFYTFWSGAALNVIIAFKIIHEIFLDIFRPYPALRDLGTALFKWAALIMVLVSVVVISVSPGWDDPLQQTIEVVQRCVRVVQCGMVLFLLAFCKNLGVSWRRLSFGIACGFGLFAGTELFTTALYSGLHIRGTMMNLIDMGAYNVGMVLWLLYSVLNRREVVVPVLVPQRWDEALTDIHPHSDAESLIPMFEHMVDRAFSKAQDTHA
jgi:MFS family permease